MKLPTTQQTLFANATAAGNAMVMVDGYNHLTLNTAITTGLTSGVTVNFYASNQKNKPDLSQAASATNHYFPIQVRNSDTNASINGSTGVTVGASATSLDGYTVQSDNVRWIGAVLSSVTGTIDATIFATGTEN